MVTKVKLSTWDSGDNLKFISVIDKGAKGDGTTDDTAAFTAAFASGSVVFVPVGTFVVSGITVPAGGTLFGAGNASVIKLKNTTGGPAISLSTDANVSNLAVDGNKANQTSTLAAGISCTNTTNSSISKVKVFNTKGDGVYVTGASTNYLLISTVEVTGAAKNGILVDAGKSIVISNCNIHDSDVVASPGDGIAIASGGSSVVNVAISDCVSASNVGRGYAFIGNGSKNVTEVSVANCHALLNSTHGFHIVTAERIILTNCTAKTNTSDGFRLEGDVQHSRLAICNATSNVIFGIREVTSGATPNYNGFIYSVTRSNGNDTVTKVGANSTVVSI